MLAKLLVLAVLAAAFVQLWLLAARRVTTARVRIEKVEKTFLPEDKLAQYARDLADSMTLEKQGVHSGLKAKLASHFAYITSVYRQLNLRAAEGKTLPAAAEWILDNYYIVEKEVAKVEESLSPDVLERISVVTEGEQKGNAVSYALAKEFVAHRAAKDRRFVASCIFGRIYAPRQPEQRRDMALF